MPIYGTPGAVIGYRYDGFAIYGAATYGSVGTAVGPTYSGSATYQPSDHEYLMQLCDFFALNGVHSDPPWLHKLFAGLEVAGGLGTAGAAVAEFALEPEVEPFEWLQFMGGLSTVQAGLAAWNGDGTQEQAVRLHPPWQPAVVPLKEETWGQIHDLAESADIGTTALAPLVEAIPTTYLGPSTTDIANAILEQRVGLDHADGAFGFVTVLGLLQGSYQFNEWSGARVGLPAPGNPYFNLVAGTESERYALDGGYANWYCAIPNTPRWDLLTADDTALSFVQKFDTQFTWTTSGPNGSFDKGAEVWAQIPGGYHVWWRFMLTTQDLHNVISTREGQGARGWPGAGHVTLGTPVEFTRSGYVSVAMDGCIIDLTTLPPGIGGSESDGANRHSYCGWATFVSDGGDADNIQRVEFDHTVLIPVAIAHAMGVVVYCRPGATGTITPWTASL